jgi:broad-specificity NMP kinase
MDKTRQDILAKTNGWIGNLDAPNILWVSGHPGVGKSTIASTLVNSLGASHRLGSSFFFARDNPTLAIPASLWCSVAYDLAQLYPVVLRVVLDKLHEQEVGVNTANISMLFRR